MQKPHKLNYDVQNFGKIIMPYWKKMKICTKFGYLSVTKYLKYNEYGSNGAHKLVLQCKFWILFDFYIQ